jgi:hypothetical protein
MKTRKIEIFIIIILLLAITISSGCVQTNRETKSSNYVVGGVTVTEVTYLIGNDGLFTKEYLVSGYFLGKTSNSTTYTRAQYEQAKNSMSGAPLPDF